MIKYSYAPNGFNPCLAAIVENIKTKEKFAVSTIRNPYGVYETTVCRAPNLWIAGLKAFLSRFVFVVNAPTLQEAQQNHIKTAELFEQLNPKVLISKYKIEGRIGIQLLVSDKDKEKNVTSNERGTRPTESEILNLQETSSKYRFWSKTQRVTLFLFPVLFVMCFFWNWWLLIPALLFLALNVVAYVKKMKLLGRNPATRDINEVV